MEYTTLAQEVQSYITSHRFHIILHLFEKDGNVSPSFFKSSKISPFRKTWKQLNIEEIKYFVNKVKLTIDNLPVPRIGDGLQGLSLEENRLNTGTNANEDSTNENIANNDSNKRKINYIDPDSQQGKELKKKLLEQRKENENFIKKRNEEKRKKNEKEETQKMNYVKLKELITKNDQVGLFRKILNKEKPIELN